MSKDQGRRATESSGPLMDVDEDGADGGKIGGDSFVERTKNPSWLKDRCAVYDSIKARRQKEFESKKLVNISVTMPDGNTLSHYKPKKKKVDTDNEVPAADGESKYDEAEPFQAYKTTPYDVAATISQGLADSSTVARITYEKYVDDYSPAEDGMEAQDTLADAMDDMDLDDDADGEDTNNNSNESKPLKPMLWDMNRPLVGPVSKLELLKFDNDQEAKTVFWHSSAHMMGEALEHLFGSKLTIGPPLKGGFYYDSYMGNDTIKDDDCKYQKKQSSCYSEHPIRLKPATENNKNIKFFHANLFLIYICYCYCYFYRYLSWPFSAWV